MSPNNEPELRNSGDVLMVYPNSVIQAKFLDQFSVWTGAS